MGLKRLTCLFFAMLGFADSAFAGLVIVSGNQNGSFGAPLDGSMPLASTAFSLNANQEYSVTATGLVGLGGASNTGPNGIEVSRSSLIGPFSEGFTPLEEGILDSGGTVPTTDANSIVQQFGALFGVFVSETDFNSATFLARNIDSGGSLNSTALFFVGESLFFTAPTPGRLLFGVNEGFVSNNSGSFSVSVTAVPEPSSILLVGFGVVGLLGHRRRRTCSF